MVNRANRTAIISGVSPRRSKGRQLPAGNPWIEAAPDPADLAAEAPAAGPAVPEASGPTQPQSRGVTPPPAGNRLPQRPVDEDSRLWVLGTHGGAGETLLADLLPGATPADHGWPVLTSGAAPRVVLIARTHARGLTSAQRALIEWASGVAHVELLGLVFNADAPGKLPRVLSDQATRLGGGAPRVWQLPWHDGWRYGDTDASAAPRGARKVLDELTLLSSGNLPLSSNKQR